MPSGKIHATASTAAAVGISAGGFALSREMSDMSLLSDWMSYNVIAAGCLSGVILTPDLDQDGTVRSHGVMRRLGCLIGKWWYFLWHAYSISFKHRSFLSHGPVISTLLRLTYLFFPCIILLIHNQKYPLSKRLLYSLISTVAAIPIIAAAVLLYYLGWVNITIVVLLLLGLMTSDVLHWVFDMIF